MTGPSEPRPEPDSSSDHRNGQQPRAARHRGGTAPLTDADRIGILGGLHGDTDQALIGLQTFADLNIHVIVQLGDIDVRGPNTAGGNFLRYVSTLLTRHGQIMYFLDGEHDLRSHINTSRLSSRGYRVPAANILYLPRGFRGSIGGGAHTLTTLGGTNSGHHECPAGARWPLEDPISDHDLAVLGTQPVDVLLTHEAPLFLTDDEAGELLDAGLLPSDDIWADVSRGRIIRAVQNTFPVLVVGSRHNTFLDQRIDYLTPLRIRPRVVILGHNGPDTTSLAVLDTRTLGLEFFRRGGSSGGYP